MNRTRYWVHRSYNLKQPTEHTQNFWYISHNRRFPLVNFWGQHPTTLGNTGIRIKSKNMGYKVRLYK